jgi:uncharacterized protein YjeT (DUF2065 family)
MVVGLLFVVIGVVYLAKPTLFRRGIWLKTSIAIRTLSEENYIRYMRIVGVLTILAGLVLIVRALL